MEPFPIRVEPPCAVGACVELRDEGDGILESGEVENRYTVVLDGTIVVSSCFDLTLVASGSQAREM